MRYRLEKKSKRRQKITINADIEERSKSLTAKCSWITLKATSWMFNNWNSKKETTVKTLWKEKSKTITADKITRLQLPKQQTNDKIVGRYCKQRN